MESSRSDHLEDLRAELRHWKHKLHRSSRGRLVDDRIRALSEAVSDLAAARDGSDDHWRELDRSVERAWERFREAFKNAPQESPPRRPEQTPMDPQTMNRKEYLDRAQETLRDWRAKIDQLKVRSNLVALEAEDTTRKAIEALDESYDAIQKRIAQLARSGESGWEKLRDEIEQAWHKLGEDFRQAGGAPR